MGLRFYTSQPVERSSKASFVTSETARTRARRRAVRFPVSQFGALHVYYDDNGNNFDYAKFIRVRGLWRGTVVPSVRSESWEE